MPEKRANALRSGDRVIVKGTIQTVKRVDPTHKDGVVIRLKGHPPINARWDDMIEVSDG